MVPSAAIVQAEALVQAFLRLAQDRGAAFAGNTRLIRAKYLLDGRTRLHTTTGDFDADLVINSAGLYADEVGRMFGESRYSIYPCRGEYCRLSRRCAGMIRDLVYPLPTPISLGIHLTHTVDDVLLVGPTARFVDDKNDYETDLRPPEYFFEQTREFLPDVRLDDFTLAYTGLRPKITREDPHAAPSNGARHASMPPADFIVERDPEHETVVHLIGIESPGLTSAPSLAETVCAMLTGARLPDGVQI
jgi:glycerol-3-phosphate dehydrogenase